MTKVRCSLDDCKFNHRGFCTKIIIDLFARPKHNNFRCRDYKYKSDIYYEWSEK